MNDSFVYKYPADESKEAFEKAVIREDEGRDKKITAVLLTPVVVFFILYCIPLFEKIDLLLLFCAMLSAAILSYYIKRTSGNTYSTALSIAAFDEQMVLEYYKKNSKKVLHIYYEDITDARFSDKDHTKFQIAFVKNSRSYAEEYDRKSGEKIPLFYDNLFLFSMNPYSYEQFFFLYMAEDHFTIKGLHKTKKFFKAYGNKNEYLERLEQEK